MKLTMNITTCSEDTARYQNREDLHDFFCGHGLNGLEVMEVGPDEVGVIHPDDVLGVHLRYWSGWMDFWKTCTFGRYRMPSSLLMTASCAWMVPLLPVRSPSRASSTVM